MESFSVGINHGERHLYRSNRNPLSNLRKMRSMQSRFPAYTPPSNYINEHR